MGQGPGSYFDSVSRRKNKDIPFLRRSSMSFKIKRVHALSAAALIAAVAAMPAQAVTVSASGPGIDGAQLAAQATFTISGDNLTISLTNVATNDENSEGLDTPGNTLTGLFFDITSSPALAKQTATITAGSLLQGNTCSIGPCDNTTTDVGGEFGFATSWTGGPSAGYGISSSGYIGGAGTLFGGANLDDPGAPDGINFGIISSLGIYNPNGGLAGDPVIQDTAIFTFTGVNGLTEDAINNISFQYGTDFDEPNLVPVPAAVWLFGSGLLGLVGVARRKS